jgi:hypothetical protein
MFIKGALYYKMENATVAFGPKLRKIGQQIYKQGLALQGEMAHEDTM